MLRILLVLGISAAGLLRGADPVPGVAAVLAALSFLIFFFLFRYTARTKKAG